MQLSVSAARFFVGPGGGGGLERWPGNKAAHPPGFVETHLTGLGHPLA